MLLLPERFVPNFSMVHEISPTIVINVSAAAIAWRFARRDAGQVIIKTARCWEKRKVHGLPRVHRTVCGQGNHRRAKISKTIDIYPRGLIEIQPFQRRPKFTRRKGQNSFNA